MVYDGMGGDSRRKGQYTWMQQLEQEELAKLPKVVTGSIYEQKAKELEQRVQELEQKNKKLIQEIEERDQKLERERAVNSIIGQQLRDHVAKAKEAKRFLARSFGIKPTEEVEDILVFAKTCCIMNDRNKDKINDLEFQVREIKFRMRNDYMQNMKGVKEYVVTDQDGHTFTYWALTDKQVHEFAKEDGRRLVSVHNASEF
jgi:putative ribosome biogenesis GTPase RsgA